MARYKEELNSGRYCKNRDFERYFLSYRNFFIVFSGVVYTAVAKASLLKCQNWWTSLPLSLFSSLVTIATVLQNFANLWALEDTIASEKGSVTVLHSPT